MILVGLWEILVVKYFWLVGQLQKWRTQIFLCNKNLASFIIVVFYYPRKHFKTEILHQILLFKLTSCTLKIPLPQFLFQYKLCSGTWHCLQILDVMLFEIREPRVWQIRHCCYQSTLHLEGYISLFGRILSCDFRIFSFSFFLFVFVLVMWAAVFPSLFLQPCWKVEKSLPSFCWSHDKKCGISSGWLQPHQTRYSTIFVIVWPKLQKRQMTLIFYT